MTRPVSVAVALSGGVDSAAAAAILKNQGYEVSGFIADLAPESERSWASARRSPEFEERAEAAHDVCRCLDIPFHIVDLTREFEQQVIGHFVAEYTQGRTPNPCVRCNAVIKFGHLLQHVLSQGYDRMATGHYARVENPNGRPLLMRAFDRRKDQTYVLHRLGQPELGRLIFPLGAVTKSSARETVHDLGLPASGRESQDVCFVPGGDYRSLLKERAVLLPGEIVDSRGNVLGRHEGAALFTVGQRRGLRLSASEPLYVLSVDSASNRVVVGTEDGLLTDSFRVSDVTFVRGEPPPESLAVTVKVRYRSVETPAVVEMDGEDSGLVRLECAQKAVTPGQSAVFYQGDEVLGGGVIT